jgi:hypothetical protein
MNDDKASWLIAAGLAQTLVGMILVRVDDIFLLPLWGITFLLMGGVAVVLGVGVLLRLWR